MRRILYMAHPIGGDVPGNIARALRWLSWLRKTYGHEASFEAPYLAHLMSGADDSDPVQRAQGLSDNCALLRRLDGIVLCGGVVSHGMRTELDATPADRPVYCFTHFGPEPPAPWLAMANSKLSAYESSREDV